MRKLKLKAKFIDIYPFNLINVYSKINKNFAVCEVITLWITEPDGLWQIFPKNGMQVFQTASASARTAIDTDSIAAKKILEDLV